MSKPLISVITASYNSEAFIQNCIESVKNQTYSNIEHILVDGNSTDSTVAIIKRSAEKEDSRISFWISEPDDGVYFALNKGLEQARGEWIYFLGSDDELYDNDSLGKIAIELSKVPEDTYFAYGVVNLVDENGDILSVRGDVEWDEISKVIFEESSVLHPSYHQGIFCRTEAFDIWGGFDTSLQIIADGDQFLRVVSDAPKCHCMNINVANMLWGGLSSNKQTLHSVYLDLIKIHIRYNLPRARTFKFFIKRSIVVFLKFIPEKILGLLLRIYLFFFGNQDLKK